MSDVLQAVLTDATVRDSKAAKKVALAAANDFSYWASDEDGY
jgi:hypothetical protein